MGKKESEELQAAKKAWTEFLKETIKPLLPSIREINKKANGANIGNDEVKGIMLKNILAGYSSQELFPTTLEKLAKRAGLAPEDSRYNQLMELGIAFVFAQPDGEWKKAKEEFLEKRTLLEIAGISFGAGLDKVFTFPFFEHA